MASTTKIIPTNDQRPNKKGPKICREKSPTNRNIQLPSNEDTTQRTLLETGLETQLPKALTPKTLKIENNLLLCRRLKGTNSSGFFASFNSLPLFVYATSSSSHAISADGVGVAKEAAAAVVTISKNDDNNAFKSNINTLKTISNDSSKSHISGSCTIEELEAVNCHQRSEDAHQHFLAAATAVHSSSSGVGVLPAAVVLGAAAGVTYPHHLNLSQRHDHQLLSHHAPYSNSYTLHNRNSHNRIHSDQTKSLQELQHEVGALLEFRDLVIETFPDLKHKMASMTLSGAVSSSAGGGNNSVGNQSVSSVNTLTCGGISSTSISSRREWEPGIRTQHKLLQKELPTTPTIVSVSVGGNSTVGTTTTETSPSSLTRSRSNSHSGKKEPKSGENNSGSVVQDSGFSTETSSSKEGHSASSTNGTIPVGIVTNRISCLESDELLNLLDAIHRKSNRLRDEVEHLQYGEEKHQTFSKSIIELAGSGKAGEFSDSSKVKPQSLGMNHKIFREHMEWQNKENTKHLRMERDRLLAKLAEMEAETLTGRIKAAELCNQVETLINLKKDLEEKLKLTMTQKLELSSHMQLMQQQSACLISNQLDFSNQEIIEQQSCLNTFQPVPIEQQQEVQHPILNDYMTFHQIAKSDSKTQHQALLGRLDGIVSTPGLRNSKCRAVNSKRFSAILLETNVLELQRHLLTLTVQNQGLLQKLETSTKSKNYLVKQLDKTKEDINDLRFQLEEKNIELEGTKAQLRVIESQMNTTTLVGNSCPQSQNDFETNRSSASTTLLISRRCVNATLTESSIISPSDTSTLSTTPIIHPPTSIQISTPSMKAMVHFPMDDIQQHSSSTESAHELDLTPPETGTQFHNTPVGIVISSNTEGFYEQIPKSQSKVFRKYGSVNKPSKIPLPGCKTGTNSGKPPTGRSSTYCRSPPIANTSVSSTSSGKFSLSRSYGNLEYNKTPNSLRYADSVQNIRKDTSINSSSTNVSHSSTSSSIPLVTAMNSTSTISNKVHKISLSKKTAPQRTTPSPRVLQNSPLPKLKRETLTTRGRHIDTSISRAKQHIRSNLPTTACTEKVTPNSPITSHAGNSKAKLNSVVSQLNSSIRPDIQDRTSNTARRLSRDYQQSVNTPSYELNNSNNSHSENFASDSDSGKVRTFKTTFLGWLKLNNN